MKNVILCLFVILIITSCSKESSNSMNPQINGKWNMESYVVFVDTLPVLEKNDIVWNINTYNNQIAIVNNVESEYPYILQSGIYNIFSQPTSLTINSTNYSYFLENGKLILKASNSTDGPIIQFSRN